MRASASLSGGLGWASPGGVGRMSCRRKALARTSGTGWLSIVQLRMALAAPMISGAERPLLGSVRAVTSGRSMKREKKRGWAAVKVLVMA